MPPRAVQCQPGLCGTANLTARPQLWTPSDRAMPGPSSLLGPGQALDCPGATPRMEGPGPGPRLGVVVSGRLWRPLPWERATSPAAATGTGRVHGGLACLGLQPGGCWPHSGDVSSAGGHCSQAVQEEPESLGPAHGPTSTRRTLSPGASCAAAECAPRQPRCPGLQPHRADQRVAAPPVPYGPGPAGPGQSPSSV